MDNRWSYGVWLALTELGDQLASILPRLLVMLVLVAIGLVVGWLARVIASRLARAIGLDHHSERWGLAPALRRSGVFRPPSDLAGALAFWALFVLFATLGIDSLAVPGAPGATAFLLAFLPPLFAAVLIVVVGVLVANFLSQGLLIAAVNAGIPEARLLARAVQWAVVLFAVATALTQLGVGKEMVLLGFGITFGGLVLALALAFGLGGRAIAREILARRLRRETPPPREESLTHL
jgi:mechanosensitive ion channel-like protein